MKFFAVATALLQVVLASHVAVRLPYLNPAGVSYVGGGDPHLEAYHQAEAARAFEHHHQQPQPLEYAQYPEPLHYQAPAPAHVETHHVGYAAAQVPAVAAVPVVKHVPAFADVPVTHIEAQHGFIEKQVDVAKPAISTRKFEVRRPAIQKHFYDIEERVVVRPAGTALVELEEPLSKVQKGPTVVQPIAHAAHHIAVTPIPGELDHHHQQQQQQQQQQLQHDLESQQQDALRFESQQYEFQHHQEAVLHATPIPGFAHQQIPIHVTQAPIYQHEAVHVTPAPVLVSSPSPLPAIVSSTPGPQYENGGDSIVVENPAYRSAVASFKQKERQLEDLQHQQDALKAEIQAERSAQAHASHVDRQSGVVTHSNGAPLPLEHTVARLAAHDGSPSVVPSAKTSPEESRANQHKLIDLLTARGGVAEVGFGREGPATYVGDAGHVRARVLSATPAPEHVEPTGERVSTRRVVVSRPIETVQEFDLVEPATKIERVSYQQPTLIKTARTHRVKVPTSVPVYGKALAPAVAHAAVPVFQKTISHAPEYGYYN